MLHSITKQKLRFLFVEAKSWHYVVEFSSQSFWVCNRGQIVGKTTTKLAVTPIFNVRQFVVLRYKVHAAKYWHYVQINLNRWSVFEWNNVQEGPVHAP